MPRLVDLPPLIVVSEIVVCRLMIPSVTAARVMVSGLLMIRPAMPIVGAIGGMVLLDQ